MFDGPCNLLKLTVDSLFYDREIKLFAPFFLFKYLHKFEIEVREIESHKRELVKKLT